MPNYNCDITIITHFLFKNQREFKIQCRPFANLTSRNHYNAEQAKNKFMRAKMTSNALQLLQNEL